MTENSATAQAIAQSRSVGHTAVDMLTEHGATAEPEHFAVAYYYQMGRNAKLAETIDKYLSEHQQFDEFFLRDLYENQLQLDQYQQVRGMRNDLQALLGGLMEALSEADSHTREYGASLQQNIRQLDLDPNTSAPPEQQLHALREIAESLLKTAVEAGSRNAGLQKQLASAQEDTDSLRNQLEQHRREALIDPLTGLYNRRAMEQHLTELLTLDSHEALSMLVLDIDHFKSINDKHGHAIGDIVIRNVADTLRKCIRGSDVAIRYGGEEFMVLLPSTPLAGASRVGEAIRKRIAALRLVRKQDHFSLDPFTISIGVATRRPDDTSESLFERADKALYRAKESGRNKVEEETSA